MDTISALGNLQCTVRGIIGPVNADFLNKEISVEAAGGVKEIISEGDTHLIGCDVRRRLKREGLEGAGIRIDTDVVPGLHNMLALAIVVGIPVVGAVMTTALIVTPAAVASLITTQLRGMFVWSEVLSVVSNCVGPYVSYYLSVSSGSAIGLSCTVLFGFIFIVTHAWRLPRYSSNVR